MLAVRNVFTKASHRKSDTARLASRTYRMTRNLFSRTTVAMSRRLPGSPVDSRSAWNVATTLEIDMTGEERVASKVVVTFPYLQRI